jgi:predicted ATPase
MATESSKEPVEAVDDRTEPPFLRRVRIRGYKSITFCDVSLEPLTILAGRNAAGKSNFLDALAFLRDAIAMGVPEAVKRRGGWSSVVCRTSPIQKIDIEIEARFTCGRPYRRISRNRPSVPFSPDDEAPRNFEDISFTAKYRLECLAQMQTPPAISSEALEITDETNRLVGFNVQKGAITRFRSRLGLSEPSDLPDLALLKSLARHEQPLLGMIGIQPFVDLGDGLRSMGFYNFHPEAIRTLQKPNPGWLLEKDGINLASVIETTREIEQGLIERVGRYLSAITEVELLGVAKHGDYETVQFRVAHNGQPLDFDASGMSDGTLRVLAALVAAFQVVLPHGHPSLVGIEEPDTALHPAAMRALVDALDEATARTQILLTTHSADMLDNATIRPENVRVVQMIDGQTVIAPVDEASMEIVRRELNTLGGLERDNLLEPDSDDLDRQRHLAQSPQESPA